MTGIDKATIGRLLREEVEIVPYRSEWQTMFTDEEERLRSMLPRDLIGRIEHFGSTAVPGLDAKPIIDMLVEVNDLVATRRRIMPILLDADYDYIWRPTHGEDGPPWYAWFIKRDSLTGARTHHIHMVEPDFEHWDRLAFRDYLRTHSVVAGEYATLKHRLAAEHRRDRAAYTDGKAAFVQRITEEALRNV